MKFLTPLFATLIGLSTQAHEGHQAFYKLYIDHGTLTLDAKLEIPDLKTAVTHAEACSNDQDFNFCAGTWLIDQISVEIDGKIHSLTLESSATEEGHLLLSYSLGELASDFKQIDFKNTAFTQSFEHYENIVEIELKNEKQGYKLTEKRTSISHLSKPNQ